MPTPLLVAVVSGLLYVLPSPKSVSNNGLPPSASVAWIPIRELVRLTFQAAVLLVLYELASGRAVRLW